jgi:hypothetical protein
VKREEVLDGYQRNMKEIYIAREALRCYSNDSHFDSRAPTQVLHFENRTSCIGYPDDKATCSTF